MTKEQTSNYKKATLLAQEDFLRYDQQKMIRKFRLAHDEKFLYASLLGTEYQISRETGEVTRLADGADGDFSETMVLFDILCYSKENCRSAFEFANLNSLSRIQGGSMAPGSSMHHQAAALFDERPELLKSICEKMGGTPVQKGDVGYWLPIFKDLAMMLVFWHSDDEFEASIELLFDKNILDFMHYETVCYMVGHLTGLLKRAAKSADAAKDEEETV